MDIKQYIDATYLKTAQQAGISEAENRQVVKDNIQEAIREQFKLIMIRPDMVSLAGEMIRKAVSNLLVGTVIGFPEGTASVSDKLSEAQKAIDDGADDLDFVVNYSAFQAGDIEVVKDEVLQCTKLGLSHHKTVKWIIEIAALNELEIAQLSALVKKVVVSHFKEDQYAHVFVKSSTGFYPTQNGAPNGATIPAIIQMLENACPLPIKAAGGVKSYQDAVQMIRLGVKRIGTSSAKAIVDGKTTAEGY